MVPSVATGRFPVHSARPCFLFLHPVPRFLFVECIAPPTRRYPMVTGAALQMLSDCGQLRIFRILMATKEIRLCQ